jgi:hypothetical protein
MTQIVLLRPWKTPRAIPAPAWVNALLSTTARWGGEASQARTVAE